jgi:serine/threonine protein kinase
MTLITFCPFNEKLIGLLADGLCPEERDTLAQHVEGCATCQEKLADLIGSADTEMWRRAEQSPQRSEVDEGMLQRLKQLPASLLPMRPLRPARPAEGDSEWPRVPGYKILGELGKGGMGIVYQARQLALQRTVALKMIRTGTQADPTNLARFRAEAAVIARLQHPNIVQIYDFGEAEGRPYFALECVAGGSLVRHLGGRPHPARPAAELVETVARAVHHAHQQGILHRDLKPANILLQMADCSLQNEEPSAICDLRTAIPKIADFGLAKCINGDGEGLGLGGLTSTGDIMGTPSYMAPEQANHSQAIGPAADIYALGVILYELLTGRPPFSGETPLGTVLLLLHNEPVAVTSLQPGVPRDLETICHKCLQKEPRKRYRSALELADDIQRFVLTQPILARPVGVGEKLLRWVRRYPWAAGLLAAGLLAPLVALIVLSLLSARLVRSNALESAVQQAELLEEANNEYSRIVQRVEQAKFPVNKTVPPTPGTVPLSIPATFLHDLGQQLHRTSKTGVKVRQYSDYPFPWRSDSGPQDAFEREALRRLRLSKGQETVHEFTEIEGQSVVRYAQARIMKSACVECHNTHAESPRKDWQEGDVRGVLEIIRALDKDEARVGEALRLALLLSAVVSGLMVAGSLVAVWVGRRRRPGRASKQHVCDAHG